MKKVQTSFSRSRQFLMRAANLELGEACPELAEGVPAWVSRQTPAIKFMLQ